MDIQQLSYLSANIFPMKILADKDLLLSMLDRKKILPIHIQLIPTNKCNFNCSFCSCGNKDKSEELDYHLFLTILRKMQKIGCRAVTITGGGEPLMHLQIGEIIQAIKKANLKVSLTTNGTLLTRLKKSELRSLTWCRISASYEILANLKKNNKSLKGWFAIIVKAISMAPKVDWAFSYIVSRESNFMPLKKLIVFGNKYNFTHIRITPDLLDLDKAAKMNIVKNEIKKMNICSSRVIYQDREKYDRGNKNCFISLLKPLIGADGYVYPCCGTQYAKNPPLRDNDKAMSICKAIDIDKFFKRQIPFDGSNCQRCYYASYNEILELLHSDIKHKEFV